MGIIKNILKMKLIKIMISWLLLLLLLFLLYLRMDGYSLAKPPCFQANCKLYEMHMWPFSNLVLYKCVCTYK